MGDAILILSESEAFIEDGKVCIANAECFDSVFLSLDDIKALYEHFIEKGED